MKEEVWARILRIPTSCGPDLTVPTDEHRDDESDPQSQERQPWSRDRMVRFATQIGENDEDKNRHPHIGPLGSDAQSRYRRRLRTTAARKNGIFWKRRAQPDQSTAAQYKYWGRECRR